MGVKENGQQQNSNAFDLRPTALINKTGPSLAVEADSVPA